mmetsp:Transcript_14871/g.28371  ORF Transcript_14871/g.28371 Transcript_14871/m.28371 type:complete len:100 (-) Transcript_14871:163-462(-)|eukprot:scaffold4587_cov182-Amphora_coffeaeformis.AAC.8
MIGNGSQQRHDIPFSGLTVCRGCHRKTTSNAPQDVKRIQLVVLLHLDSQRVYHSDYASAKDREARVNASAKRKLEESINPKSEFKASTRRGNLRRRGKS